MQRLGRWSNGTTPRTADRPSKIERPSWAAVTTEIGWSPTLACRRAQSAEKASSSSRKRPARSESPSPSMYCSRSSASVLKGYVISSHDSERFLPAAGSAAALSTHLGVPRRAPTDSSCRRGKCNATSLGVPVTAPDGTRRCMEPSMTLYGRSLLKRQRCSACRSAPLRRRRGKGVRMPPGIIAC
jgi:hypothetical protein